WSSPAAIESAHGVVWGASPAILADSWSVAYVSGGQGPDGFHYDLLLASSRDAGRTWQVSTIAESVPFQSPQLRADARSGDLVVAYAEGPDAASFGDVVVRVLPAAGGAWSETARFTGLGDAAMDPQVALDVAPDGSVYLAFWALDDAGGSQRHAALGRDGWTRSVLGAGAASGEYTGLAAWDGGAFAVWPRWDADAPTLDGARVPLP
ncbi:MAG TPA: hypothetical protein VM582_07330, partial [Candidatus Thermoplasmatota archaeon]|nr:hypothetical protein [Candidatus Thermoplasmatota archaeon]